MFRNYIFSLDRYKITKEKMLILNNNLKYNIFLKNNLELPLKSIQVHPAEERNNCPTYDMDKLFILFSQEKEAHLDEYLSYTKNCLCNPVTSFLKNDMWVVSSII